MAHTGNLILDEVEIPLLLFYLTLYFHPLLGDSTHDYDHHALY